MIQQGQKLSREIKVMPQTYTGCDCVYHSIGVLGWPQIQPGVKVQEYFHDQYCSFIAASSAVDHSKWLNIFLMFVADTSRQHCSPCTLRLDIWIELWSPSPWGQGDNTLVGPARSERVSPIPSHIPNLFVHL